VFKLNFKKKKKEKKVIGETVTFKDTVLFNAQNAKYCSLG
jgi:hypothetical protein